MNTSAVRELAESSAFQALTDFTERFEPFRVLGIHNKELVHSRLLAHMLCHPDALQAYWLYHLHRMEIIACLN